MISDYMCGHEKAVKRRLHSHNLRNTWSNSHMPQQTKVIVSTEEINK
jgi:hypothetical protein